MRADLHYNPDGIVAGRLMRLSADELSHALALSRVDGLAFRTFTPFRLGEGDDTLELLGFARDAAPAGHWLGSVAPGDRCHVLGPRRSMNSLNRSRSPLTRALTTPGASATFSTTPAGS